MTTTDLERQFREQYGFDPDELPKDPRKRLDRLSAIEADPEIERALYVLWESRLNDLHAPPPRGAAA